MCKKKWKGADKMAQCIKYFPQEPINLSSIPESHSQMKELTLEEKKKKILWSSGPLISTLSL